ncbi:YqcI/YcgG family protein [Burkholderia sp. WAC0059]|nr:YqcI/YcgG family protein [Burkholderia sp. WAC0059]
MPLPPPDAWTGRILNDEARDSGCLQAWWLDAYGTYRTTLEQRDYPCFFGQTAERRGEMFYAFCEAGDEETLRATMRRFVEVGREAARVRFSLALFFAPDPSLTTHEEFLKRFWHALQTLHDADGAPMAPAHPDDPLWEFSFGGRKMFVVGTSPTYRQRRSRVVGDGMVLLFQPRELFTDPETGEPISAAVRRQIHARMLAYDGMPVHPDIGFYGDPDNREWKQYCLSDDNTPETGVCPFAPRPGSGNG